MINVTEWKNVVASKSKIILFDLLSEYQIYSLNMVRTNSWNAIFNAVGNKGYFCVKVFNEETSSIFRTLEDLNCIGEIMHALYNEGFPHITPPVLARSGYYVCRCGGFLVMVFPWIKLFDRYCFQEDKSQTIDIATKGANLLCKLHSKSKNIIKKIKLPSQLELPQTFKPSTWAENIDKIWTEAERNLCKRRSSELSIRQLKVARRLADDMIKNNHWFFKDSSENEIITHGDYRPENILIMPKNEFYIIDFDLVHLNYLEVDVAYGALNFAGPRWMIGPRDWNVFSAFILSYKERLDHSNLFQQRLELAVQWVVLKAISLSFKSEQVFGRLRLFYDIKENYVHLKKSFEGR